MKKIIMIITSFILINCNLFAKEINMNEVEIYISVSKKINFLDLKETNEIFFGEYNSYIEKNIEEYKTMQQGVEQGFSAGLGSTANGVASSVGNATGKAVGQGIGMGLGIGLIYGISGSIYEKVTENDVYVLVKDFTSVNGEKSRVTALFYAKSFNDENIIKELLNKEIENKIRKDNK